jgi:pimeloyl-ACP methyl ester carboxylesterase
MNDIRPYRIEVPQADLDDLHHRLSRTRLPDEWPSDDYGITAPVMRRLLARWQQLDWRAIEAGLNEFPQFTTVIDGERVHLLHVRSRRAQAPALILTHGWPGSFLEFTRLIPLLTRDFHLVVPSIPGFGFGGPTNEPGWGQDRIARAFAVLMQRLGYDRYGAHGGDWGAGISRALAVAAPGAVTGVHLTYLPTPGDPDGLGPEDQDRVEHTNAYGKNRPGYQVVHATRPQTVGYALADSPAGQLAWLADWFLRWADPAAPIDDDTILTDVSIYWFSRTAASSSRLVKESGIGGPSPCPVPMAVAVLPHDIVRSVRPLAEARYDVRQWTEFPRGGHFAALEVPGLLADDISAFFTSRVR